MATFTDSPGHVATGTATVTGGTWTMTGSPTLLASLADGALSVNAQVGDKAGNPASATNSDTLDTAASITSTAGTCTECENTRGWMK